ncbi:MAG: hypothetical protein ACHP9T_00175 [Caulobacterales bacterium]|jgi:hypothetical protein
MKRDTSFGRAAGMGWTTGALALLAVGLLPAAPARGAMQPAIEFEGARLGMTEAAWKAMPPPGRLSPHARPACSNDAGGAPGLTQAAVRQSAGPVVCAYVDAYGKLSLPEAFTLDAKYRVDQMTVSFANDRLVEIRCNASTDAYDALVHDFQARYGPTAKLVRDKVRTEIGLLPRVTQTWSTPAGAIQLVDPTPPYTELSLRFTAGPQLLKTARR